jgi:hypothetical protein
VKQTNTPPRKEKFSFFKFKESKRKQKRDIPLARLLANELTLLLIPSPNTHTYVTFFYFFFPAAQLWPLANPDTLFCVLFLEYSPYENKEIKRMGVGWGTRVRSMFEK